MDDAQVKHLEFIQTVISRQAGNSFLIKGWALTVTTALFGLAVHESRWQLALMGLFPAGAFGWLDAYFLRQERLFRCLYAAVVADRAPLFSMDTSPYAAEKSCSWRTVVVSRPLCVLYVGLVVLAVFLAGALSN